jgi:uncharacterized protein YPO0396
MKTLCRIRLINWHFFIDETIPLKGSCLISGENTAGKSTVLDAIQLVMTTNTRKFNVAANEKSSRDLRGYVRCKLGSEDRTYLRTGSVVSYVALEFYEDRPGKHFVLGVKIDSSDEEASLVIRWYTEECRLEDLSFLSGRRPSSTDEFRHGERRVRLIQQVGEAKARFALRLGGLEDRFFDIIPKSLAFKPMDNVKQFINRFILAEHRIEVATLRQNISVLKELEDLLTLTKDKIEALAAILQKNEDIVEHDRELRINELFIQRAEWEAKKETVVDAERSLQAAEQRLQHIRLDERALHQRLAGERERLRQLQLAQGSSNTVMLIREIEHRIERLREEKQLLTKESDQLLHMLKLIRATAHTFAQHGEPALLDKQALEQLTAFVSGQDVDLNESESQALDLVLRLKSDFAQRLESMRTSIIRADDERSRLQQKLVTVEQEIANLRNKKFTYPPHTIRLKQAIEAEFVQRGLNSEVRIFSELLEVTDKRWQDAVEGYLHSQRFYLLVEPRHYDVALQVYDRIRKEVHSVGLVNTGKLDLTVSTDPHSLAHVVKSDHRYARAYATYLLNRVIRCEDVLQLQEYPVAITPECMLYQNFAVRKIKEEVYRNPFIGANAYEIQRAAREQERAQFLAQIKQTEKQLRMNRSLLEKLMLCKWEVVEQTLIAPRRLRHCEEDLTHEQAELKKAQSDPNYIELQMQISDVEQLLKSLESEERNLQQQIGSYVREIQNASVDIEQLHMEAHSLERQFDEACHRDMTIATVALQKFAEQSRTKKPALIVQNFSPRRTELFNRKMLAVEALTRLQNSYCAKYQVELGYGWQQIDEYVGEHHKLTGADLIRYESDLAEAKERCQLEFRESFLASLKEKIEIAKLEFRHLNQSLKDIYYGEDRYRFELTPNRKKEAIYKMITAETNEAGPNLWSQSFADEYKEEMDDLFAKLTAYDDHGEQVLSEYTDYRGYLDYDIIVEKRDGSQQRFSKIYGDKSGGETQTPYYVAIAASFAQLYKSGDTIRIMMLDEAFDKMDDGRISAMMDFFNSQHFQIIIATPPAKMEIIGEKVDTILLAMRDGNRSVVEVFAFE